MDINFNVDLDIEVIEIVIDNAYVIKATIDDEGKVRFTGFHRLDNEDLADIIKAACTKLFKLDN